VSGPATTGAGTPPGGASGPHLLVRSGGRAGRRFPLGTGPARIGRRADLEVPLDPERDLEVSALHAELLPTADGWALRDLGSRNGTSLNGRPVGAEPSPVRDGDEIRLGSGGPVLVLRSAASARSAPDDAASPPGTVGFAAAAPASGPSSTQRVRAMVRRETLRLRGAVALLLFLLVAAVGAFLLHGARERAAWDRERAALETRADSLLASADRTTRSLEGELGELGRALESSREELGAIRMEMARRETAASRPSSPASTSDATPAGETEAELRDRLREATAALERQQLAASLDFDAIQGANRRAVALLFVERPDGTVATGTAFAVEASGTMITSRHVVLGEEGMDRPLRLGVQFADSPQVFPARLVAASTEWDLAAVAVENLEGEVPVVAALNLRPDTLYSGAPLASLGFPLGGEAAAGPEGASRPLARPLLSAGVLLGQNAEGLEIQGYGEPGASGSPVFDRDGAVVGILFGGRWEGRRRILVAVPADAVASVLRAIR
jgi:S1-C subfamily serine protease